MIFIITAGGFNVIKGKRHLDNYSESKSGDIAVSKSKADISGDCAGKTGIT